MITFSDQKAFLQLVKPPAGYRLTGCIGTTYSLDLTCVVAMAQAASKNNQREDSSAPDIYEALQGITEFAQTSIIFFQNCQMKDEDKQQALLHARQYSQLVSLLDEMVVAVSTPHMRATFHPKVWVVKFELSHGSGEPIFRLLVTSRNLSRQMDWEIGCVMEGRGGTQPNRLSSQLSRFLTSLQGEVPKPKTAFFRQLVSELQSVHFQHPPRTRGAQFLFKDSNTPKVNWIEPAEYTGLIIISPFISMDMVAMLSERIHDPARFYLITLPESAFKLRRLTNIHQRCFVFDPGEVNVEGAGDVRMGLHAKMYLGLRADDAGTDLMLGSANCTTSGLIGSNTEAMVRLKCPTASFKDFLGTFVYQNMKSGTPYGWLRPFENLSAEELCSAEEEAERRKVLSEVRSTLAAGRFRLEVKTELKIAVLRFVPPKPFLVPERVHIRVSLWGCPAWKDLASCLKSHGAVFESKVGVYADFVRVEVSYKDLKETFMTVASSNINKRARNKRVIGSCLQEPGAFFRYLRLVLKMPPQAPSHSGGNGSDRSGKRKLRASQRFNESFLEEVLVNASYNPVVCEQIEHALDAVDRGNDALKEFGQFWRSFVQAQEEIAADD